MELRLIDASKSPFSLSVAAARSCYAPSRLLWPEEMDATERAAEISERIARSTLAAGHLTTRQHSHFTFAISSVSRYLVWSFLHSHPFYNSEQVSQRYTAVDASSYHLPSEFSSAGRFASERQRYCEAVEAAMAAYREIADLLRPGVEREYYQLFPARARHPERWQRPIESKVLEIARYILPVATHTRLYHTISLLTLYRYHRLARQSELPTEVTALVDAMVALVCEHDPLLRGEFAALSESEARQDETIDCAAAEEFCRRFDEELGDQSTRLIAPGAEAIFSAARAAAVIDADFRLTGSISGYSDKEQRRLALASIAALLGEGQTSEQLASTLGESQMAPELQPLRALYFTIRKRLSHTADSQNQRHRTILGGRAPLARHYFGRPDLVTPPLLAANQAAAELYEQAAGQLYAAINDILAAGVTTESALYLLPNGVQVRYSESGDLLALHHRWRTRSCYTAQEEIFAATIEEIRQFESIYPELSGLIRPPCVLRRERGVAPTCPEADRYCGVRVWELPIESYERIL